MTDQTSSSASSQKGYVVDAENAAEMARLMLQDHLLTSAMGGPIPEQTNLEPFHHVLDIACGPGGWLFDLVKLSPHIHGVGIDISQLMIEYAGVQATSQGISNLSFRIMDATEPLNFADNTFDLVNARILAGFLPKGQWQTLLSECARINNEAGIIRLTEAEWGFTNSGALDALTGSITRAMHLAGQTFSPHGRTFGITPVLRLLLQQAGYEVLGQQAHVVDFSAGTPLHQSSVQNHLIFQKLVQPFLVQMQVLNQVEAEQLYEQMEKDFQSDTFCGIDYYLTVWGRKPKPGDE
jgi:ubiquinone/menaquinone biosynthesis C-methylase UbiE